jgi:dethiobiotin synthetase
MTGFFVTATGTEIGKTFITQALVRYSKTQKIPFIPSKPIISGWSNEIEESDTGLLLKAAGLAINEANIDAMSPWRFTLPLSPDMAAVAENREMDIQSLIQYCNKQRAFAQRQGAQYLIEGVGGLMSPIKGRFTNLEWIKTLNCRCIVVTGSYLGTLSHTLTALKVLENEGVEIAALVVNETPRSMVPLADTADYLHNIASFPVIDIPWQQNTISHDYIARLYHALVKEK